MRLPLAALESAGSPEPARLLITLGARKAFWHYYRILPPNARAEALSIIGTRRAEGKNAAESVQWAIADLGVSGGTADPVVFSLRRQFAGRRIATLTSARPFPPSGADDWPLTLMLGDSPAIAPLPTPPFQNTLTGVGAMDDPSPRVQFVPDRQLVCVSNKL